MSITATRTADGGVLTIAIEERFDFSMHERFRRAYEGVVRPTSCIVDLSRTEYMDSSALGMLVILRDHLGQGTPITLLNARPAVRQVLAVANFQQLFEIV